jgi:gliding motility-associated-like protein
MPRHVTKWGGSYSTWQTNVTTMRNYIYARCDSITQGMKDCYNLTGPYNIIYRTDPPGIAEIDVNTMTLTPSQLPFSGTYYGNITTNLDTRSLNPDYEFDHWEMYNGPSPTIDSAQVSVQYTSTQTVTAVYKIPSILYIPTAFSPNGDGINDELMVMGKGFKSVTFDIYERWGQRVFGTTDYHIGWDGTFQGGQKCSPGVYAYRVHVDFLDGTSQTKTGNVTLVR